MVQIILPNGALAHVQDGVWHADDAVTLDILNRIAPYHSSPSLGDVDYYMAHLAIAQLGGVIVQDDGPSQPFDPTVVY